jgi:hypothetical protein
LSKDGIFWKSLEYYKYQVLNTEYKIAVLIKKCGKLLEIGKASIKELEMLLNKLK